MSGIVVLMLAIGVVSGFYIYLSKKIEEEDTLHVTLTRYDVKSQTTFTKEVEVYKDHEGNFNVYLEQEYPRYIYCASLNGNKITIETNKNLKLKKAVHYVVTKIGLIKIYDK
jgi:hypothetical protein